MLSEAIMLSSIVRTLRQGEFVIEQAKFYMIYAMLSVKCNVYTAFRYAILYDCSWHEDIF